MLGMKEGVVASFMLKYGQKHLIEFCDLDN